MAVRTRTARSRRQSPRIACRRPKTISDWPWTAPPSCMSHSGLPVAASSAKNSLPVPPKTRPPAVDRTPAQGGGCSLNSHRIFPVVASSARTAPHVSSPLTRATAAGETRPAVLRLAFVEDRPHLARPGRRASSAGCRTGWTNWPRRRAREDERAFDRRLRAGPERAGPSRRAPRPTSVSRTACPQELAGLAIEHVVERVAVGHGHQLARPAVDRRVEQHRHLVRVPIVHIVRRELEVPLDLSVVGVEREQRTGVEIVARPHVAVVVGPGIAGPPIDRLSAGSYEPVNHVGAPPVFQLSPSRFRGPARQAPESYRCATRACRSSRRRHRGIRGCRIRRRTRRR